MLAILPHTDLLFSVQLVAWISMLANMANDIAN
jgi:hypothetical protein